MFKQVLDGLNDNGSSTPVRHTGGELEIVVMGNFGGGTVTAYANFVNGPQAVPLNGGTWTSGDAKLFKTIRPCDVYLTLAGATSPDLDAWI